MTVYNKLVRDRIPEIIEKSGKQLTSRILDDQEYIKQLNIKLYEEIKEYEMAKTSEEVVEELADLLELTYAIANYYGASPEQLEQVRSEKCSKRGGFNDKIFLMEVEDE